METLNYNVNTVEATYKRAKEEGLNISKYFIRQACKDGRLKHCRSGNKILIHYDNLLELLKNGDIGYERQSDNGIIRKLPERLRPTSFK